MEKRFEEATGMYHLTAAEGHILHETGSDDYPRLHNASTPTPDEWEELTEENVPPYTQSEYREKVKQLVAERYDVPEELALQRKMFAAVMPSAATLDEADEADGSAIDPEKAMAEFAEYNAYVEACKAKAKVELLNRKNDGEENAD